MGVFDPTTSLIEADPTQGYIAYAIVADTAVYVTSASAQGIGNPSVQEFIENGIFPGKGVQCQALHAAGTELSGGSIEFDLADRGGNLLSLLYSAQRGESFKVQMGTPSGGLSLDGCYMESLTLSSAARKLVSGSIQFKSAKDWELADGYPILTKSLVVPYWASGNAGIKEWSVNTSNALKPIYKNHLTDRKPRYLRVGKTQGQMQITMLGGLGFYDYISVGIGSVTITGVITESAFNVAKRGSQNEFTYTLREIGIYTAPPPGGAGGPFTEVVV